MNTWELIGVFTVCIVGVLAGGFAERAWGWTKIIKKQA